MLKGTYLWLTTDAQWINVVVWFKTINKLDFGLLMVHNWRLNCICFKMWSIWIKELMINGKGTLLTNEDSWDGLVLTIVLFIYILYMTHISLYAYTICSVGLFLHQPINPKVKSIISCLFFCHNAKNDGDH